MKQRQEPLQAKREFINPIYKDRVTVLKTGEETGGQYALGQLEVEPGGGNDLHIHTAFTETFTAVKGTLGVMYKDRKLFLKPGESISIPVKTPHNFFNDSNETIVCHVKLTPSHHDGFIKGLAIGYGLAGEGKTTKKGVPKNIVHLSIIMALTDTRPAGVLGILMPLFTWIASRARKNGLEKRLLEKYYYK